MPNVQFSQWPITKATFFDLVVYILKKDTYLEKIIIVIIFFISFIMIISISISISISIRITVLIEMNFLIGIMWVF